MTKKGWTKYITISELFANELVGIHNQYLKDYDPVYGSMNEKIFVLLKCTEEDMCHLLLSITTIEHGATHTEYPGTAYMTIDEFLPGAL
jgi:hypothetical protein